MSVSNMSHTVNSDVYVLCIVAVVFRIIHAFLGSHTGQACSVRKQKMPANVFSIS